MGASAIGLTHVAVQFPVYEFLKRWLGERRQKERGEASVADRLSTVDLIIASSTSKVIVSGFGLGVKEQLGGDGKGGCEGAWQGF